MTWLFAVPDRDRTGHLQVSSMTEDPVSAPCLISGTWTLVHIDALGLQHTPIPWLPAILPFWTRGISFSVTSFIRKGLGSLMLHWDVLPIRYPLESGWMTFRHTRSLFHRGGSLPPFFPFPCIMASCVWSLSSFQPRSLLLCITITLF